MGRALSGPLSPFGAGEIVFLRPRRPLGAHGLWREGNRAS